jgi:beta-glucosidase
MGFPENFTWGVATASYQIEGAAYRAGGGQSVWDTFCRRPSAIANGESGELACDHYARYLEDVALLRDLGVGAYRFSISWPRVLPAGRGTVNQEGLDFYDRLVDALLQAGVAPHVTLFHWDYPLELYLRGGWLNRDSADWFADYVALVVNRLSDRVAHWMTLNEPQCFIGLGLQTGIHAPGDKLGSAEVVLAAHHTLLAHGKAVQTLRARSKRPCQIGFAPVGITKIPATDAPADIEAARASMFAVSDPASVWNNSWWLDPIFFGRYPEDGVATYGAAAPAVPAGDMETIRQPLDFFGVNIYNGQPVRRGEDGKPVDVPHPMGIGRTSNHWPVTPASLYWGPKFYWDRYEKPIVVTENGLGCMDWVSLDGKVHDPQRIDFLRRYLLELERAQRDGVDVRGYFQWSLMDNFEWQDGYKTRFGLVYVDYQTFERIPKDSVRFYQGVVRSNGATLHDLA